MLVDTSIWIDHLRHRNAGLVEQLELGEVWTHPFVIGELACGNLTNRAEVLALLSALRQAPIVDHSEVLGFVEQRRLMGRGLGWVDMHLLASAAIGSLVLWTRDERLDAAARDLGLPDFIEWDQLGNQVVVRRASRHPCDEIHAALFPEGVGQGIEPADTKAGIRRHIQRRYARR